MNNPLSISIQKTKINGESIETINARDLHVFLGSMRRFANWIRREIKRNDFIENVDYTLMQRNVINPLGGRPEIDYHISLEMAKHICMLQRTARGKEARRYFIACEKKLKGAEALAGHAAPQAVFDAMKTALLEAQPTWRKILRYRGLGLNMVEIGRLIKLSKESIRRNVRRMEGCGLLSPPKNLRQMQKAALHLIKGGAA